MPERRGGQRADEIERVLREVGLSNIETVLDSYRRFAEKVDYRALVDWSIKQPLDDLLQPLFLAAVVTISRDLELGDVGRALAQMDEGEWQWGVRRDGPHGSRVEPMPGEEVARHFAASTVNAEFGYTNTLMRRRIGPWVGLARNAPASEVGDSADAAT